MTRCCVLSTDGTQSRRTTLRGVLGTHPSSAGQGAGTRPPYVTAAYVERACTLLGLCRHETLLFEIHHRNRATDREDRNWGVEPQLAAVSVSSAGDGDERADLEPALARLTPRVLVLIREQLLAPVAEKLMEKLPIPTLVDPPGVRCGRPMRDAACADHGDALGPDLARSLERAAELITALERDQRRSLAVDVDRNDGQVVAGRQEAQWHHDAVIELPLLCIGEIDVVHHVLDQPQGQFGRSGNARPLDPQPGLILDRSFVEIGRASCRERV